MVRPPSLRRLLAASCVAGSLIAAGCGGSSGDGDADPASVVPTRAAVYLEGVVRPEGERREGVLAAARKLLREDDPAGRLQRLLEESAREEGVEFSYERDVKPWLGERAGLVLGDLTEPDPDAVVVFAATDTGAAEDAIEKVTARQGTVEREYEGVAYRLDRDDRTAVGVVEDFVVLGDEALFRQVVDAAEGDALADSDRYRDAVAGLPDDRIGSFFVDTRAVLTALARDPETAQVLGQLRGLLDPAKAPPVAGALLADAERVAIEAVTRAGPGPLRRLAGLAGGGTDLVGQVPGDSWLAFGVPEAGRTGRELFRSVAGLLGGAVSEQIRRDTGIDLERDVFSWIGDVAVFVRGTTAERLDGAIVIEVTNERRAREAVGRLVGAASAQTGGQLETRTVRVPGADQALRLRAGLPRDVILATGRGRVVLAYGARAAADGLEAREPFEGSATFADAKAALGDGVEPAFVLAMPQVLRVVEGLAASDPELARARPYLEAIGVVAAGGRTDGDRVRSTVAVTLR